LEISSIDVEDGVVGSGSKSQSSVLGDSSSGSKASVLSGELLQGRDRTLNDGGPISLNRGAIEDLLALDCRVGISINDGASIDLRVGEDAVVSNDQ